MKISNNIFKLYSYFGNLRIAISFLFITGILLLVESQFEEQIISQFSITNLQIAFFFGYDFEVILKSWGDSGIEFYKKYLIINNLFAISLSLLLLSAVSYYKLKLNAEYLPVKKDLLFVVSLAGYLFLNLFQNIVHLIIIKVQYFSNTIVVAAGVITIAKWALLFVSFSTLAIIYFRFRRSRIK
jgi:hypothetical protein